MIDEGIFLTTSESAGQKQSVLRVDAETGKLTDQWLISRDSFPQRIHPKNSHASPSIAWDDKRLYASFNTRDAIEICAMTPDGRKVWQKRVCDFQPAAFQFGFGASPIVENDLVIVAAEYDGSSSGIYALDSRTGNQVWKIPRPKNLNFASPIVAEIAGKRQLLIAGADKFASYDPTSGKLLWESDTTTEAICGTVAWDGRRVLASGGNPRSGTWCVLADGSGKLLWENSVMCYEQSLLTIQNHAIAVADGGVAYCWRTMDGKEMWKKRLFSGPVSASPLLVGNRVYAANERGVVAVFSASPDRFEPLAETQTGESIFATPIAVNNRLYIRTAMQKRGKRQEYLIAIGNR